VRAGWPGKHRREVLEQLAFREVRSVLIGIRWQPMVGRIRGVLGIVIAASVGAILLIVLAIVGVAALLGWALNRGSHTEAARDDIQRLYIDLETGKRRAEVDRCAQVDFEPDGQAYIYRCRVRAANCQRSLRFVVYLNYGAEPYSQRVDTPPMSIRTQLTCGSA